MQGTLTEVKELVVFSGISCVLIVWSFFLNRRHRLIRSETKGRWAAENEVEIVEDRKAKRSEVRRLWNGTTDWSQEVCDLRVRTKEGDVHRCFLRIGAGVAPLVLEGRCPVWAVWAREEPRGPANLPTSKEFHPLGDDLIDS